MERMLELDPNTLVTVYILLIYYICTGGIRHGQYF